LEEFYVDREVIGFDFNKDTNIQTGAVVESLIICMFYTARTAIFI
jgi:hypothetical protein